MTLADDVLLRAVLATVGVALATGLLGCFVIWRRMAYFGDATAHAAILGVALSLALSLPVTLGVLAVAGAMALVLTAIASRTLAADAVLAVLAHGSPGVGLLVATALPEAGLDLEAWLVGDALTASPGDLAVIWGGAVLVALFVRRHWGLLVTSTLSPDLARAAGMDPLRGALLLALVLAGVVAVAAQVVGALLVTALLVIPAASARRLAATPEAMALAACGIGAVAALGGLGLAVGLDAGVGPSVVTTAAAVFGVVSATAGLRACRPTDSA